MGGFWSTSAKHRTVLKTCHWENETTLVQNSKTIVGACCLLNFSCSAYVREGARPLKSSRKYELLDTRWWSQPTPRRVQYGMMYWSKVHMSNMQQHKQPPHTRTHTATTNHFQGSANGSHSFCLQTWPNAWPCVVLQKATAKSGACGLIRFNIGCAAWPFSVGRVTCLVGSVFLCTERREKKREEEEEKSRPIAG